MTINRCSSVQEADAVRLRADGDPRGEVREDCRRVARSFDGLRILPVDGQCKGCNIKGWSVMFYLRAHSNHRAHH